jgi:Protein of unknown function (DUF3126)
VWRISMGGFAPCAASGFLASLTSRMERRWVLDKIELRKLQEFLRQSFGVPGIKVGLDPKNIEEAVVSFGERALGRISVDDEDGDRSFSFAMKIPVERPVLQDYLRRLFDNDELKIVARAKKTDSVELNRGEDFLGVVSADDPKGKSYTLQMAILDFDLEDL